MNDPRIRLAVILALALGSGAALPRLEGAVVITEMFSPGLDVPDGGTGAAVDTQTIQVELSNISSVSISLDISGQTAGAYNGNLISTLTHSGADAVLLNQPGRTTANPTGYSDTGGFQIQLADGVGYDIHTYQDSDGIPAPGQPVSNLYEPDGRRTSDGDPVTGIDTSTPRNGLLANFVGQSGSGDWVLSVQDAVSAGAGAHRLDSWGIQLVGDTGVGTTVFTDGSTLTTTTTSDETFQNQVTFLGNTLIASPATINFNGPVLLGADTTLTVALGSVVINGNITEDATPRALTIAGIPGSGGTVVINGIASHTGDTTVRDAELTVNGQITTSHTRVEASGILDGTGTLAQVTLNGGAISGGAGSDVGMIHTGTQVWKPGSAVFHDLSDAAGVAGSAAGGWDLIAISGKLKLCGDPSNPFTIILSSQESCGCPGLALNFDNTHSYAWTILTTTCGIEGFDPGYFTVDTSNFANDTGGGTFSITQSDKNLVLGFTPFTAVPEPTAFAGAGLGLLLSWGIARKLVRR